MIPTSTDFSHCTDEQHRQEGSRRFILQAPILCKQSLVLSDSNTANTGGSGIGVLQHLQAPNTTATHALGETNRSLLSVLSLLINFVETAIL